MRNYIPKSPLTLSLAASFVVFIVFALIDGVATACADPQTALNRGMQRWDGTGSDRAPTERTLPMEPGRYRSRYRTHSARAGAASTGPATATQQQAIPCVFDNFVWFKDQEIINEIRNDLPSFDGTAPETGDSINKILGALERMLKKKGLPKEVEYVFFSEGGYQYRPEHVFAPRDLNIPLCNVVHHN